jgi:SAM-dependent methyltransferase
MARRPQLPSRVARRIDGRRTRMFLDLIGPPTRAFVEDHGLQVRHGPLQGMFYLPGLEATSGDLVAKLLGAYEAELHPALEQWIAVAPERIIDVGCAEGYYAVGLAHAIPSATVYAYDIDQAARARCAQLAALNEATERVVIEGECRPETLNEHPESGVALLSDCEGYERILLDPGIAPRLAGWRILVELHEFLDAGITEVLRGRFADTHEIEVIEGVVRDGSDYEELAAIDERRRRALLSENRPGAMRWMALTPRSAG